MVLDLLRPDGLGGDLVISGTGRDLATGIDGEPYLVDAAATAVTVSNAPGHPVVAAVADSATVQPTAEELQALVGQRSGSGFRKVLAAAAPELVTGGSLVHLLLDETPPATLIAGSVLLRAGLMGDLQRALPSALVPGPTGRPSTGATDRSDGSEGKPPRRTLPVGICAGWVADGAIVRAVQETGLPFLGWGPAAPELHAELDGSPDELAWHPVDPLPPDAMRRRRLIDVWRGVGPDGRSATAPLRVSVRYRDTYGEGHAAGGPGAGGKGDVEPGAVDRGAVESVVHEYGLTARIELDTWTVLDAVVTPGPLPSPDCPGAAASAVRLVGHRIDELRDLVRDDFTGASTCTHLNDVFRSLADVRHLWESAALARGERP